MYLTAPEIMAASVAMIDAHPTITTWNDIDAHTIAMRKGLCAICNDTP